MAGATGLEPATSGVTGRPFSNEINGALDKIRTITCDKRSNQCLARERRKSHSPRPEIAHRISPFPEPVPDRGGWLSGLGPFGRSQAEGAAGRRGLVLATAITVAAVQAPAAASAPFPSRNGFLRPSTHPPTNRVIHATAPGWHFCALQPSY
jgi:hypothetical protein